MPNGPLFKFIHDFGLQKPGRISGVLNSQGEVWREQRNFMVKTVNTLGLRNSSLEDMLIIMIRSYKHSGRFILNFFNILEQTFLVMDFMQ